MKSDSCPSSQIAVEMRGITKRFPGVLANDSVNLEVRAGEVHALLGENGAGKTTLMNILSGLYLPDEGNIIVGEESIAFGSPQDAIAAGIGVVHQHFRLVDVFSVAENITIGLSQPRFRLDMATIEKEVAELASRHGWQIDPSAPIWQLSVGEQQRVEILKALYRGARVLVLDEPTAVLTPQEAQQLGHTLRQMAAGGKAVIYISHKLDEVMEVADRISVLRAGRNVATVEKANTNKQELTRLMVGRDVPAVEGESREITGEVVLTINNLNVSTQVDRSVRLFPVCNLNLKLRRGEIIGLAGVSGNGQRELAEAIAGMKSVESGEIWLDGQEITNWHPSRIIAAGVSFIPEDRLGTGLIPALNLYDNVILKSYRQPPISRGQLLSISNIRENAERLVREFTIKVTRLNDPVWKLSGGNLQRLLLAREITSQPRLMIAVQPTRGLDVQAAAEVHRLLFKQRDEGAAILMISEDLDEILALSDTIAVICDGQIMGIVDRDQADIEEIGLMMCGAYKMEELA